MMRTLNLHTCRLVSNITQLVNAEWEQNFNLWLDPESEHMKTGTGWRRVVRSAIDRDVNSGSLLYNFDHYVRELLSYVMADVLIIKYAYVLIYHCMYLVLVCVSIYFFHT